MNASAIQEQLKTTQTLNAVAFISAPISLLIGGVMLSGLAVVCAIVSLVKLRKTSSALESLSANGEDTDSLKALANQLQTQSFVSLGVSVCAFAFNFVTFITLFSALMSAMQTGDYSNLFDALNLPNSNGGSQETSGAEPKISIWDK